jgi:hypothetical protein
VTHAGRSSQELEGKQNHVFSPTSSETNLLELIAALDASILDDEILADGAKAALDKLQARKRNAETRIELKRRLLALTRYISGHERTKSAPVKVPALELPVSAPLGSFMHGCRRANSELHSSRGALSQGENWRTIPRQGSLTNSLLEFEERCVSRRGSQCIVRQDELTAMNAMIR